MPRSWNGEYIILLKFGGRSVSGFEDIEGSYRASLSVGGIGLI